MAVTHAKVSGKADGADSSEVLASDWNASHVNGDLGLPLALTGAVAATRYVGGHATVAPTTGTFVVGDFVITSTGKIFICTSAGSPGTWTQADASLHVADTSAAHAAASVSADSTTLVGTGTDVQAVLEELDNGIADHLADTTAAHAATAIAFTPAGTIAATTVQAAIEEVATEAGSGTTFLSVQKWVM
jgi:hypothetical protein